jgi:anti-anti-sigma factor
MLNKVLSTHQKIYFLIEENIKMQNAPLFYEEFTKSNDYLGKNVFLDFSKVSFVDSSGIGTLIRCADYLKYRSAKLVLVNINKSLYAVFRLAGLNQIFDIIQKEDLKNFLDNQELKKIQSNR